MQTLFSALESAKDGAGRIVILSGEPGMGKSRCAEELARHTGERDGVSVVYGHCLESLSTPPYWPWYECLNECIRTWTDDDVVEKLGRHASIVAELLPDLRERIDGLPKPALIIGNEAAQCRLFDVMCEFIRDLANRTPLMLVLEDLHWADIQTLQFLEFLADRIASIHVLVIGTVRDNEESHNRRLSSMLGGLIRSSAFERISLKGFSDADAGEYLDGMLQTPIAISTRNRVLVSAEGNPFFLAQMARQLIDDPDSESIPEGIREAIGRRLDRVSEETNALLTLAAVIGREFTIEKLLLVHLKLDEDSCLDLLTDAVQTGVIEELQNGYGAYRFTHALIQETLIEEIPASRQTRMHADIAVAMETFYGESTEEHAAELLYHFAKGRSLIGCSKAIRYATRAGNQALSIFAVDEAVRHFSTGLDCKGDSPMDDEKAELLYGFGRCCAARTDAVKPYGLGDKELYLAFSYYMDTGLTEKALQVAVAGSGGPVGTQGDENFLHMYEAALELVEPGSTDEARILCHYADLLVWRDNDWDRATPSYERALAIARRHGNPNLEMHVLFRWLSSCKYRNRWDRRAELIAKADKITGYDDLRLRQTYLLLMTHCGYEDIRAAIPRAEEAFRLSERTHKRYRPAEVLTFLYLSIGNWTEMRKYNEICLQINPFGSAPMSRAALEFETGNREAGDAILSKVAERVKKSPVNLLGDRLAYIYWVSFLVRRGADRSHLDIAEQVAREIPDLGQPSHYTQNLHNVPAALAHISAVRGDSEEVIRERYAAAVESIGSGDDEAHARLRLGFIACAAGDLEAAIAYLSGAEEQFEQQGAVRNLVLTCYDFAAAYMKRGDPDSLALARVKLELAGKAAEEIGTVPLKRLIKERLAELESIKATEARSKVVKPARSALDDTNGLTPREVEVLGCLAKGLTNQEIATQLMISEKTVHNHLSHIFAKLKVGNRTEAARIAFRMGLDSVGTLN
jgi:DNA-binding CsgD family transcriptional regulator